MFIVLWCFHGFDFLKYFTEHAQTGVEMKHPFHEKQSVGALFVVGFLSYKGMVYSYVASAWIRGLFEWVGVKLASFSRYLAKEWLYHSNLWFCRTPTILCNFAFSFFFLISNSL